MHDLHKQLYWYFDSMSDWLLKRLDNLFVINLKHDLYFDNSCFCECNDLFLNLSCKKHSFRLLLFWSRLYDFYPALAPDNITSSSLPVALDDPSANATGSRSPLGQAWVQLAALGITLGISIVGGLITGKNHVLFWELPGIYFSLTLQAFCCALSGFAPPWRTSTCSRTIRFSECRMMTPEMMRMTIPPLLKTLMTSREFAKI